MTNQEAIALLKIERDHMTPTIFTERVEAMDMAISALHAQDSPKPTAELVQNVQNEDLILRKTAIALANSLKDDLPDDERIADTVMAHNEGILEYQTKLSLLPSAQPDGIPLEWIDKHLEWLDNCDNDFAQLAKVGIRAMVEIWKKDKT